MLLVVLEEHKRGVALYGSVFLICFFFAGHPDFILISLFFFRLLDMYHLDVSDFLLDSRLYVINE
jgi:hypothetical protein